MEWIKLNLSIIRSASYLGCDPVERATWLNLLTYCADRENGGVISDCAKWADRKWQQVVAVTLKEVSEDCGLFWWEGDSLRVKYYPSEDEDVVKTRRAAGKKGAAARWQNGDLPYGKSANLPDAEQSRAEQRRTEKSRAEGSGCGGIGLEDAVAWIEKQNGTIPDKPRAKALASELIREMTAKKWRIDGQPVANPMGLLINRLKKDKAYIPKS